MKDAFDKSDRLVLEMVEPTAAESQSIFMKVALDQSGTTLRSKLTEADRAVYDAAMTKSACRLRRSIRSTPGQRR